MHRLAPAALLTLSLSLGCSLDAKPWAGTVIEMTLTGAPAQAIGRHLELWARNQYNDVVRVSGIFDTTIAGKTTRLFPVGFTLRPLITMDDPCMIDPSTGAWLIKAEAYGDSNAGNVHQTPEEQAQQVRSRIAQLTPSSSCDGSPESMDPVTKPYHCGQQGSNVLIGVIVYELVDATGVVTAVAPESPRTCETSNNAPGCIAFAAAPADRLAACSAYWDSSILAYTPNPYQIITPLHGGIYGEETFVTTTPPSAFDGIRIDSPIGLKGIQELWMTVEPDQVDPLKRGPIFLDGTPGPGGLDVVHIDLSPPFGSMQAISGSAALEVNLDTEPAQF